MAIGSYLVGAVVLAAEVVAVVLAASAVRRRWWGPERSPVAWLAVATIGLVIVYSVALVLGAVGLFRPVPVAAALIGGSALLAGWAGRHRPGGTEPEPARSLVDTAADRRPSLGVAAGGTFALVSVWVAHTVRSYRVGMLDGDTLWYHLPFAARFVQTGSVTVPHRVLDGPLITYFPANNEVLHALVIVPWQRDLVSPLLNLGWLALALLAGWCLGRRHWLGPVGLIGVAFTLSMPILTYTQAGSGRNDVTGVALLLTAAALFAERDDPGRRLFTIGLASAALGLAAGVKVSLLAPTGLLFLGGTVVLALDHRRSGGRPGPAAVTAAAWAAPAAVFGAYWYVRNWATVGNPLPWLDLKVGPVGFEGAPLPDQVISDSSVMDRLTQPGGWSELVQPGLRYGFGPWWPLVVAAAVGLVAAAAMLGRTRTARMLAVVAGAGLVIYGFSPNTAPGPVGEPLAPEIFVLNARYATPALALAVAAFVVALGGRDLGARVELVVVTGLAALTVAELTQTELNAGFEWSIGGGDLAAGAGLNGLAVAAWWFSRAGVPRGSRRGVAGALALAVLIVATFPLATGYLDRRYAGEAPFAAAELWPLADELHGERIALSGSVFQYPFAGEDLSNRILFLGVDGRVGTFRNPRTCQEWRRALARERATIAVVAPQLFSGQPNVTGAADWTRTIPGAIEITPPDAPPTAAVFRLGDAAVTEQGCQG